VNATARKFGHPASLVAEYPHWLVLCRPQQATLGALVLVCREAATAFGALSTAACAELAMVSHDIENTLHRAFAYDKINYLMLMMVDPDVHFHVLPRYAASRDFDGTEFGDAGWPGPPRLDAGTATTPAQNAALTAHLAALWPARG